MRTRNKTVRILRFLGKTILVLLLILLSLILLIHTQPVQKRLTHRLTSYLSTKIGSRVEIEKVKFSLLGNLSIDQLQVWDRDSIRILSVKEIKLSTDILDLLSGDFIFNDLYIEGVNAELDEYEDGINIQYILEAFIAKGTKDTVPSEFTVKFNSVVLENIDFNYASEVNGSSISLLLAKFTGEDVVYSTNPDKIKINTVLLDHADIAILTLDTTTVDNLSATTSDKAFFTPDFGLGIQLEINKINIRQSAFNFHTNEVVTTAQFDPSHIAVTALQLGLTDILIHEDTLALKVDTLSGRLSAFNLNKAHGDIYMNRDRLELTGVYLKAGDSEVHEISGVYAVSSITTVDNPNVHLTGRAQINLADLTYFISDSVMAPFRHLNKIHLTLTGDYNNGVGRLDTLAVQTGASKFLAVGSINDIWNMDKLNWNNMSLQATVGPEFKRALTPYIDVNQIPPALKIDLTSTGDFTKMFIDGNVNSTWGNVTAKGDLIPLNDNIKLDMDLMGQNVSLNHWVDLPWLGPADFAVKAKGVLGNDLNADIKGVIQSIELQGERIQQITFDSKVNEDSVTTDISIADPHYHGQGHVEIAFTGPIHVVSQLQLDSFRIGELMNLDSTLAISGAINSAISINQSTIIAMAEGKNVLIQRDSIDYILDLVSLTALISPDASNIDYFTSDGRGHLTSNFDVQALPAILKAWSRNIIDSTQSAFHSIGNRILNFDFQLEKPAPLQLLGLDVDQFTSLHIAGDWDEPKQIVDLKANSGKFVGFGISLDTIHVDLSARGDSITSMMRIGNFFYHTMYLGELDFNLFTTGDTAVTHLFLSKESDSYIGLGARILPTNEGVNIYPDTLLALGKNYLFDRQNPIRIMGGNVVMEHFQIYGDSMHINLDGDMNAFDVDFTNVDLTNFNILMAPDTNVISSGKLNGTISYIKDQALKLDAHVDSLSLYNSVPLTIAMTAERIKDQVPFQFLLSNAINKIDVNGRYFFKSEQVDGSLALDISDVKIFSFLFSDVFDEMKGALKGEAKFNGPLQAPVFNGYLRFLDVGITTASPRFTFNVEDDMITLTTSGVVLKDFTFYDAQHHPLTVNGNVTTKDYLAYTYDLNIKTDNYALLNIAASAKDQLKGLLVIGTDIQLSGNEKDTYVKADIIIKDTTQLVYELATDEAQLLKTEGIIEFVDPGLLTDSSAIEQPITFYDSLMTSFPDFNLNAVVTIQNDARLKVITNAQSGDFFEASGGGKLNLDYDRTGQAHLAGTYAIKEGVYSVSFYDLVKKNFQFVPGSSINWSGSPESGELDVKAVYTVASNSIGLVGNEIGENEKSVYKRSLDYTVGINISGSVDKPIVTFSLDLPKEERANYPVLANKLDRLKLPEFQTELNKQVFGLLVLGGFLPDASATDVNSNQIATTALYNSVNSLLASQLNRFAGQHIKGVNIDVGIQSYADYSTPGGKTQTAMDFRVSKSILNERLSFEVGGDFDINSDQSGGNKGNNYRGDVAIIYDLTGNGDKQLKLFNNETYDIIYQEIRNTGISLVFIREFDKGEKRKKKEK